MKAVPKALAQQPIIGVGLYLNPMTFFIENNRFPLLICEYEVFGAVNIEAMSRGLPIISFTLDAIP